MCCQHRPQLLKSRQDFFHAAYYALYLTDSSNELVTLLAFLFSLNYLWCSSPLFFFPVWFWLIKHSFTLNHLQHLFLLDSSPVSISLLLVWLWTHRAILYSMYFLSYFFLSSSLTPPIFLFTRLCFFLLRDFLPRSNGICTRRPLVLQLYSVAIDDLSDEEASRYYLLFYSSITADIDKSTD